MSLACIAIGVTCVEAVVERQIEVAVDLVLLLERLLRLFFLGGWLKIQVLVDR
jgi:hypothetical protein